MATHTSILAWRIPTDRGAWRATVHRVTKSRTQVEQLSKAQHRRVKVCNVKVNKLYHGNLVLFLVELSSHTLEISHDTTVFCLFLFLMILNLTAAKVVSLGQGLSSPYIVSQNPMINHIVLQEITYPVHQALVCITQLHLECSPAPLNLTKLHTRIILTLLSDFPFLGGFTLENLQW